MSTGQPLESFNDVVELLKSKVLRELVPVLTNLVKIMLTLPASTCTAERSFSGLRRLKSYLRSGMKQQRFKSVAIMNVHRKETKALSFATFIDNLSSNLFEKALFTQPSCDLMSWQYNVLFAFFRLQFVFVIC